MKRYTVSIRGVQSHRTPRIAAVLLATTPLQASWLAALPWIESITNDQPPAEVICRSEGIRVRVQVYTRIINGTIELTEDVYFAAVNT